jgi:hypothetical protein
VDSGQEPGHVLQRRALFTHVRISHAANLDRIALTGPLPPLLRPTPL